MKYTQKAIEKQINHSIKDLKKEKQISKPFTSLAQSLG